MTWFRITHYSHGTYHYSRILMITTDLASSRRLCHITMTSHTAVENKIVSANQLIKSPAAEDSHTLWSSFTVWLQMQLNETIVVKCGDWSGLPDGYWRFEPNRGEPSTSTKTISFLPYLSSGPGTYWAPWGPILGQYHPRLKPLIKANPLCHCRTLMYVSGRCPVGPTRVSEVTSRKPLHSVSSSEC